MGEGNLGNLHHGQTTHNMCRHCLSLYMPYSAILPPVTWYGNPKRNAFVMLWRGALASYNA